MARRFALSTRSAATPSDASGGSGRTSPPPEVRPGASLAVHQVGMLCPGKEGAVLPPAPSVSGARWNAPRGGSPWVDIRVPRQAPPYAGHHLVGHPTPQNLPGHLHCRAGTQGLGQHLLTQGRGRGRTQSATRRESKRWRFLAEAEGQRGPQRLPIGHWPLTLKPPGGSRRPRLKGSVPGANPFLPGPVGGAHVRRPV